MKIISTYKDYYDYLSGIWGVDPLVVLDRRNFKLPQFYNNSFGHIESGTISVYIGGTLIEGFYYDGKCYYGEDLLKFGKTKKELDNEQNCYSRYPGYTRSKIWRSRELNNRYGVNDVDPETLIFIDSEYINKPKYKIISFSLLKTPIIDNFNINEKFNCPILVKICNDVYEYPILKDLNVNSVLDAEQVYKLVSDWISLQKTKSEVVADTRPDSLKIESKGFNNKTSFRPNMK